MNGHVAIVGAGPAGLGAAWELQRQGHDDFTIYEQRGVPGGLASSEYRAGQWYDFGGHVLYVRNEPFKAMLAELFADDELVEHPQRRVIELSGATVPYPIQRHIDALPESWRPLAEADQEQLPAVPRRNNFLVYLLDAFGPTLCEHFFFPYNRDLWGVPLETMSCDWLGDLVPKKGGAFDCPRLYPAMGGIGEVWTRLAATFAGKIKYGVKADAWELADRNHAVISSAPLKAPPLKYTSLHVTYHTGWDDDDHERWYALGNVRYAAMGDPRDRDAYTAEWNEYQEGAPPDIHRYEHYAYPVPTLDRDELVAWMLRRTRNNRIWSVGRFGTWRYEQGHMDQCFLQGVQAAQEILSE